MPAITLPDLNNAKLDVDHIASIATSTELTTTDRLGQTKRTLKGQMAAVDAELAIKLDNAQSQINVKIGEAAGHAADSASSAGEALGYLQTIRATSYGAYAEDPATDPLGNPPTEGDEYWNTTAKLLKRWNGTTWQASDINTANLAAPTGASLVGFRQSGTGAVATTTQKKLNESVSVLDWGADPTGAVDATSIINGMLAVFPRVRIPAGTWLVDYINVPSNRVIETDGFATIIKHKPQASASRPCIVVQGSNTEIGSLKVVGNIATDIGEWNHAIQIYANSANQSNIRIGDVLVQDIRGDAVFIGAASAYTLSGIRIGKVTGDNIYRNCAVVSGGNDIEIKSVTGTRIGFMVFDIEPEPYNGSVTGVKVGYIKGRYAGVNSAAAAAYCDGISIDVLDIDPNYTTTSSPEYTPGTTLVDGITLRNIKHLRINKFKANGFARAAAFGIYNAGELGVEFLDIGHAEITDCAKTDTTYYSYFKLAGPNDHVAIERIKADVSGTNKRVFTVLSGLIKSANVNVGTDASFARACENFTVENIKLTGTGTAVIGGSNVKLCSGTINIGSLFSYAQKCVLENVTVTATTLFVGGVGYDNHIVRNSTLNSVYYADGFTVRDYSMAFRFGGQYVWADSSGRLRIKGGTPTSDTDGTVIGAQT